MSVEQSFLRIETWLLKNAPNVLRQLNRPLSSIDELDRAELILGAKFPPSVREAYTYHDGESSESTGLFGGWRWLPLREILQWNEEQKQHAQKHHAAGFQPSFMIPLLVSQSNFRYVETSDEEGREETPVIEWNHEAPARDVKYGSVY